MIVIDKLCYKSRLRYVNASEKFVYATLSLIICVVGRSIPAALLLFAVNGILTVRKGGIPLSRYIKLLRIPAAFLVIGIAAVIVNVSKTPLDAFALQIGEWYLTGSREGIERGVNLFLTAFAAVSCLYFLSLSTTITDLLGVLKKLHVPALVTELMLLIYRFIFLLTETASSVMTAQDCRLGNRDFRTKVKSFGGMGTAVFVKAVKRSNAMFDAMESRGYDGTIRVLSEEHPAKAGEIGMIAVFETVLIVVTVWTRG